VLASVEYTFDFGLALRGGVGKGLTPGFGSTDFRVFAGASWAIFRPVDRDRDGVADPDDACRKEPEDLDGWEDADGCPDPDNDADGLPDLDDTCPDEPEDFDQWEDLDGCPDLDNDGDSLSDAVDTCPDQAEDADFFQDEDGCPDPDNDNDGIDDIADSCPLEAETEDGCPDPDNDGDGVLDEADFCPDVAEEKNGVRDEDGCPDGTVAVRRGGAIAILEPILFKSGSSRIESKSERIVRTVAKLMLQNSDILQLRIEGHTDNKGDIAGNQKLSQRRAEAVMRRLVALGVDGSRLEAVGYGDARPVGSNRTEDGRAKNRRIEFRILAQEAGDANLQRSDNPWGIEEAAVPENPWTLPATAEPKPLPPPVLAPVENPW
jgi:outer membrane protein OmpA-like peptidoglycan-associated protein